MILSLHCRPALTRSSRRRRTHDINIVIAEPAHPAWEHGSRGRLQPRIYWENKLNLYAAADVSIPAAITVFPGENYEAPRSWAERAYHKLIYYNKVDKGGHYAAWEQPQLFSQEVRAAFRSLRQ